VPSDPHVTACLPSGARAANLTAAPCRKGGPAGRPVAASHTRATPSSPAVIVNAPDASNPLAVNRPSLTHNCAGTGH